MIAKLRRRIEREKERLKKKRLTENFGVKECRMIRDYSYHLRTESNVSQKELEEMNKLVDEFEEWCALYTG